MKQWWDVAVLGALASIVGAALSAWQARKSASGAKEARRVRDELAIRKEVGDIAAVATATSRILKVVSKIGASGTESMMRGVRLSDIAQDVDEYRVFIGERSGAFAAGGQDELIDNLCLDLDNDIAMLSKARSFDEAMEPGRSIYRRIMNFYVKVGRLSHTKATGQ